MAKKATEKEDLSSKSYEELEKMAEEIMVELSKEGIGLDQSSKLYRQGKAVLKEMEDLGDSVVDASLEETQRIGATVTRLKVLFQKLEETGGWNDHCIQKTDIGYRIYHLNVNYVRIGDIEYRIGILVNEKD